MKPTIGILQRSLQVACLSFATLVVQAGEEINAPIPEPIGYISDYGRVVSPADERKLAQIAAELERKTGVRVRVLTVPDLGGQDIQKIARLLVAAWSESSQKADKTILILDALAEKRVRIEYGHDIVKQVSDDVSRRVQQQVMLPNLAQGERGTAYLLAVIELSVAIGLENQVALYTVPGYLKLQPAVFRPGDSADKSKLPDILLFVPLLLFMVGMARLESKMARATVLFDAVFRRKWRDRWVHLKGKL